MKTISENKIEDLREIIEIKNQVIETQRMTIDCKVYTIQLLQEQTQLQNYKIKYLEMELKKRVLFNNIIFN